MIPRLTRAHAAPPPSSSSGGAALTAAATGPRPSPLANAASRRRQPSPSVVAFGERRSANRTRWTTGKGSGGQQEGGSSSADTVAVATLERPEQQQQGAAAPDAAANPQSPPESASDLIWRCASELTPTAFAEIDRLVHANLSRCQRAFRAARVGPHHFSGSTGYGHGDLGREALDGLVAELMGAESAIVRPHLMSGTHAIAAGLFAVLRPGDELLAVVGAPYDTMEEVIGLPGRIKPGHGSLSEWGVTYRQLELSPPKTGGIDWEAIETAVIPGKTRLVHVQRSCGYALRPTLTVAEIGRIVASVKRQDPTVVVAVDNCYGEFTEMVEPCAVGADLVMGSLIKNAGGTLAPCGGYVAGRKALVEAAAARMSAPGVGMDAGAVDGATMRLMFQGLFMGPQATGEALKGGRLVAEVMAREGYRVVPVPSSELLRERGQREEQAENGTAASSTPSSLPTPASMITAIELGTRARMVAFCRGVQRTCPVGSYVLPEPGVTAGYGDEVIFADGTFVDGSTAELSADGPLREPYVVYCQGGTHWTHWALALESAVEELRGLRMREDEEEEARERAAAASRN